MDCEELACEMTLDASDFTGAITEATAALDGLATSAVDASAGLGEMSSSGPPARGGAASGGGGSGSPGGGLGSVVGAIETITGVTSNLVTILDSDLASSLGKVGNKASSVAPILGRIGTKIRGLGPHVLAVTAVVGGLFVAYKENFLGVRDVVNDVVTALTPLLQDVVGAIRSLGETAADVFADVRAFLRNNRAEIESAIGGVLAVLRGYVSYLRSDLLPAVRFVFQTVLVPIFRRVAGAIRRNFGPVLDELGQTFRALVAHATVVGNVIRKVWLSIDQIVTPIVRGLAKVVGTLLGNAIDQAAQAMQLVMNLIQGDFGAALVNLKNMVSNVVGVWSQLAGVLEDGLTAAIEFITTKAPGMAKNAIKSLGGKILGWVGDFLDIGGKIIELIKAAKDWILNDAPTFFADAFVSFGRDVANLFINAINDAIPDTLGFTLPEIDIPHAGTIGGDRIEADLPNDPLETVETGGFVAEEGAAVVHEGERVVPAAQVTDRGEVRTDESDALDKQDLVDAFTEAWGQVALALDVEDEQLAQIMQETAEGVVARDRRAQSRTRRSLNARPGVNL